jgi:hypothetical protein
MIETDNSKNEATTKVAMKECAPSPREIRAARLGQEWADDAANAEELERLGRWWLALDPVDRELAFDELPGQGYSTATWIAEIMTNDFPDRECARESWEDLLDLEPYEDVEPVEIQAFVLAACDVWESGNPILK